MTRALHRWAPRRCARRASAGCGPRGEGGEAGEEGEEYNAVDAGEDGMVGGEGGRDGGGAPTLRGRLLEGELDVRSSSGRLQGALGAVVEVVVFQAAVADGVGSRALRGRRTTHPSDRSTWPRSMRRTGVGCIPSAGSCAVCVACAIVRMQGPGRVSETGRQEAARFLTRTGTNGARFPTHAGTGGARFPTHAGRGQEGCKGWEMDRSRKGQGWHQCQRTSAGNVHVSGQ